LHCSILTNHVVASPQNSSNTTHKTLWHLAAKSFNRPVTISFVEMDGKLVHGMTLQEAIQKVDELTDGYTSHFGINCAHPTPFAGALA
jgi:S-methylmethionine-dependent homocysteine/selenocysteine methylase